VAAAGTKEGRFVGKVPVHGDPADARTFGDLADGGRRRTESLVELDRGIDDPLPRLILPLCTTLELVGASHLFNDTRCPAKI
jgi:hypothetical protein